MAVQDTGAVLELYSVPIEGGATTKLNDALVATGDVWEFPISSAGGHVAYRADKEAEGLPEFVSDSLLEGSPGLTSGRSSRI